MAKTNKKKKDTQKPAQEEPDPNQLSDPGKPTAAPCPMGFDRVDDCGNNDRINTIR